MWLIKLAWKNMWRNKGRTVITMAAIFFAVILSVITSSLQTGVFDNLVKNVVSFYSGYAQVHKQGYWDEQILDNCFESSPALEQKILQEGNFIGIASRLESFALASSGDITRGSLVVGIDPDAENSVTSLKGKVVAGDYIATTDRGVLLAEGLSQRLKLTIGDTVVLIGQGYHGATAAGKYAIQGIVKFGSPQLNDKALFMPLALAQEFYNAEHLVTSYILSPRDPASIEVPVANLQSVLGDAYEVMSWKEMMPDIKQHIESDSSSMKYIQGFLYLLICFGIFSTLLMMMVERRFEMGMLVALGMKKMRLARLLIIESIFTVLSGCILGIIASIPAVYYLSRKPLRIKGEVAEVYELFGFEPIFPASTASSHFISQGLAVVAIGLVLSAYPVYKVIRLKPVTAMKR